MKTKLLITGSGGFIGSNLIRYILKNYRNYDIASIDYCTHSNVINTIYSNKGHNFYIGNINDSHLVDVIFQIEKPDILIHTLSLPFNNIETICNKYNTKLLQIVSYKEEEIKNYNIPNNIIRISDNFGPRQQLNNIIPKIIFGILNNKSVEIDGMQPGDWIHIQDTCSAIVKILERGELNKVYDISANQEFTNLEVFQEICNFFNRGHDLLTRLDDKRILLPKLDSSNLRTLDWVPMFKFKNGLMHTAKWYQNNSWFLKENK